MTETITPITMWPDSQGTPWLSEDEALLSNARIGLTSFLDGVASSGTVMGMAGCNTSQLAGAILGTYTVAAIEVPEGSQTNSSAPTDDQPSA